jgi:hypothetical protein
MEQSAVSAGVIWAAVAAGAAAIALIGGFLGWVVKLSIKSEFSAMTKGFATERFVEDKVSVHEQIHHKR